MLQKLSDWLERFSEGWVVLIALVTFLLFTALVLPRQASEAERSAGGAGSPDMSFSYSAQDLYRMAEAYGEQGRTAYVRARFTFDLIWPLVYTFFLATAISWLFRGASTALLHRLNLVPVLGALFDYLENISTSLVMLRYPQPTAFVDQLAPILTLVKWILVYSSFVVLLVSAGVAVVGWMRDRSRRA
jgi:hypothetical protein